MKTYEISHDMVKDAGLREYMQKIYRYMAVALFLTGSIAFYAAQSETIFGMMYQIQGGMIIGMKPLGWVVAIAPVFVVMVLSFGQQRMSLYTAQLCFWGYAALVGLSLALLFQVYTGESIARTFFITAATFSAMSLYGYTTQRDLTGIGSFMIMGLIGLVIASLVNLFLRSPAVQFVLSFVGVLVFVGLTAFDTQQLKLLYLQRMNESGNDTAEKLAIMGALKLYLDFINIFLYLLQFLGNRKR